LPQYRYACPSLSTNTVGSMAMLPLWANSLPIGSLNGPIGLSEMHTPIFAPVLLFSGTYRQILPFQSVLVHHGCRVGRVAGLHDGVVRPGSGWEQRDDSQRQRWKGHPCPEPRRIHVHILSTRGRNLSTWTRQSAS
jgi:hypothetical protein